MKRFSLGLAAVTLTASLSAYAALPTDAAPFQVNIPNLDPAIIVSGTAYLLRPSSNDQDYAVISNVPGDGVAGDSVTYTVKSIDPEYDWAFAVMLGYIFPCSGNDIRASWIHFDNSDSDTSTVDPTVGSINPLWNVDFDEDAFDGVFFTSATGTEDFKYDAVDLNVGQYVNLGTRLQVRLFGGLRYAHIERNLDITFDNGTTATTAYLIDQNDSKFDGIGPLFGVDSSYHIWSCFGLVTHADMALLVGTVKSSTTLTAPEVDDGVLISTDVTTLTADDTTRVIPGFDGKLGLDYTWNFNPCGPETCDLTIEAGYQWTVYIDVVDRINPSDDVGEVGVPIETDAVQRISSNVGFDGPYLTLTLRV